ncbi:hypothetical protein CPB86DRAFT_747085 [Serendipita vermifera]|nr:hypothetical protein CPB86DRAFT_747085 [Serendipita vermifera]
MSQLSDRQMSGGSTSSPEDQRAREIRARYDKFRILIIGRANAGKTTILQRTCNTTEAPLIYDVQENQIDLSVLESSASRGIHDIDKEMVFKSNPSFRFHDSLGFESGGTDELKRVKAFIENRSKEKRVPRQLHAIWYCIPVDDSRLFTTAEQQFFSECGTGNVPVIVIFTKFDALDNKAFRALRNEGQTRQESKNQAPQRAISDFEKAHLDLVYKQHHPPKGHVYLRDMNKEGADCSKLIEQTAMALDNEVLQRLFVSTQRTNLELSMKYGIEKVAIPTIQYFQRTSSRAVEQVTERDFRGIVAKILNWFPQYKIVSGRLLLQFWIFFKESVPSNRQPVHLGSGVVSAPDSAIISTKFDCNFANFLP